MAETKQDVQQRFDANLGRVAALVALYRTAAAGRGRPAVAEADVLRAGVVLLHASLEDLLRSVAELLLPARPADVFANWSIGLPSNPGKGIPKLSLEELLEFRGKQVEDVLAIAIQQRLEHSTYNNFREVARAALEVGLDAAPLRPFQPDLDAMMKRRHHIAHRADRNSETGRGQHIAVHLADATVETWMAAVQGAGGVLLAQVP